MDSLKSESTATATAAEAGAGAGEEAVFSENENKQKPAIRVSFNLKSASMDDEVENVEESSSSTQHAPQYREESISSTQHAPQYREELNLKASARLFNKIVASVGRSSLQEDSSENVGYSAIRNRNESISRHKKRRYYHKELKYWTYMMLEKPTGRLALLHRLFTFSIILLTILFSAFTTMQPISDWAEHSLFFIELFVTIYFFIEYLLRIWSCDCRPVYRGWRGKLKVMARPIMVIELLAFVFGVILIIGSSHTLNFTAGPSVTSDGADSAEPVSYFGTVPLTILRFLQLVRLLYVDRKAHTWIILLDVCYKHKFELISSVYIGFITLLLSSYLIYHCEKSSNEAFHTYSDAVYWAIITMTTIGYGDVTPKTFYGKIIATGLCVIGVAFWTLPGGIIGSGFAFKIEQRNKIKKFNRLVPAAAYFIQTWWRKQVILDIPTQNTTRLIAVLKAFDASGATDNGVNAKVKLRNNEINDWYYNIDSKQHTAASVENSEERALFLKEARRKEQESMNQDFVYRKLRPETIVMIRTILYLRFFVAKNKFKFAHKPYDFKDVIEQYTKGNMDILVKIKELQRKLDQNSNTNSRTSTLRSSATATTFQQQQPLLKSRLLSRQLSFNHSEPSRDHHFLTLESRIESIENKLDQLISLYSNNSQRSIKREDDIYE